MISLRPFTRLDFPRLIGWIASRELMVQWAGPTEFTFPLTETQLEKYLAGGAGERPVRRVYAPITGQGDVCGHIEIGAISYENNSASLCRVFVAPEYRGTGICTPMVRQALAIGFDELGLRRIDLRVYAFNAPGIRCYEKAGFVKEGLLRRSQKVGEQIWDTVVMGILREEWGELNTPQAPAAR
ncbi:MAG: aminoglycoside adenylyltransferase [Bacteroidetes bacterium]|jgi:RimJ/RimL family protein N-acetyltransferase|nr:aminoglycoside adenylyltransferase [Bacteroidota bacterium]